MAKTAVPETAENNVPKLFSIEMLKSKKNTSDVIFYGVCVAQGWKPGKGVSEDDYDKAVATFKCGTIGRGTR